MADDPRRRKNRDAPPDDEAALSARLRGLGERLSTIRTSRSADQETRGQGAADTSAIARGLRVSAEFVAGVLVGSAIGWLFDRWLGTSPWGLFVFLMLGFAGGVLNVLRSAGLVSGGLPDSTTRKDDTG